MEIGLDLSIEQNTLTSPYQYLCQFLDGVGKVYQDCLQWHFVQPILTLMECPSTH